MGCIYAFDGHGSLRYHSANSDDICIKHAKESIKRKNACSNVSRIVYRLLQYSHEWVGDGSGQIGLQD